MAYRSCAEQKNRWYDPNSGRWISEDPIGFAAGDANLYRYVGNRVTGARDPSGLQIMPFYGTPYWLRPDPPQQPQAPWDEMVRPHPHVLGGSTAELVASLTMTYSDILSGDTYHLFYSQAFDHVAPFQRQVVSPARKHIERGLLEIANRHPLGPMEGHVGRMKLTAIDLQKILGSPNERLPVNLNDVGGGMLGWAINGPSRIDASFDINYVMTDCVIKYDVVSVFNWHDELDWNTYEVLYKQQETAAGKAWAGIEGVLNFLFDETMGLNYYFTIFYEKKWSGTLEYGADDEIDED